MQILKLLFCTSALALACTGAVYAQVAESGDAKTDYRLERMLESTFLTVTCDVPSIQPKVANLRRSWMPPTEDLLTHFFGGRDNLLSEEEVISPLWGDGRRYKSGMVLHLAPIDQQTSQLRLDEMSGVEVVPTFLDVYSTGFIYANNVPHKPVYATDVKVLSKLKADVTYHNVYDETEGLNAAESMIGDMFGKLQVPAGFQSSVLTLIQHFGERQFVYRAVPEYLTEYNAYESAFDVTTPGQQSTEPAPKPKVLATHKVAVPVLDVYVHVMLDGEKMLTGMEYFWDSGIAVSGQPEECLHAGVALSKAREQLFEHFEAQPPLVTVSGIMLAFIEDRGSRNQLVPAWMFDAWYQDRVTATKDNPHTTNNQNIVQVPMPFAINALTGELIML